MVVLQDEGWLTLSQNNALLLKVEYRNVDWDSVKIEYTLGYIMFKKLDFQNPFVADHIMYGRVGPIARGQEEQTER